VRPELVAQIKFTEWTADGKLRHPVYLGLRDDKPPLDVRREDVARFHGATTTRLRGDRTPRPATKPDQPLQAVLEQLRVLEDAGRDGTIELPGRQTLAVTNLRKVFWPKLRLTKGDLFRYYVQVAPCVLPAIADRPLVMKRFPNGIAGKPFYQHRAEQAPQGVRVEKVAVAEERPHLIGGDLITLMYTTQLAAISQDPWFSRVQSAEYADYAAIDLDPPDDMPFRQVLEVARHVHDELERLGAPAFAKTSGAAGLHIYIPLPPRTPYEAGLIVCQIVATVVASKYPKLATVERTVRARGGRIYLDYLQNILGKTLASAYSARASEYAGVSAPLTWREVHEGVNREDFTIRTMPDRLKSEGDLWKSIRAIKPVDLSKVSAYAKRAGGRP
jgi:bifunctional non-homologous end joining protein LigD